MLAAVLIAGAALETAAFAGIPMSHPLAPRAALTSHHPFAGSGRSDFVQAAGKRVALRQGVWQCK